MQNIDDCIARVELWAKGNTQKRTNESRKGVKKRFPTISSEWDMQNMPHRSGYVTSFKNLTEAPLVQENRSRKITRHPCQPESATHCQAMFGPGEEQEQVTRVNLSPRHTAKQCLDQAKNKNKSPVSDLHLSRTTLYYYKSSTSNKILYNVELHA